MLEALIRNRWLIAVLVLASSPLQAAPQEPPATPPDPPSRTERMIDEVFFETETINKFDEVRKEVTAGGEDPLIGEELPIENHPEGDLFSDVFQVSHLDNPFVTDACRKEAIRGVFLRAETPEKRREIRDHLVTQIGEWDVVRAGEAEVHLSDFLGHLHDCDQACGLFMSKILKCHIDGVKVQPHMIVYFETGRPQRDEAHNFPFGHEDRTNLESFAQRVDSQGMDLMLLSRASILHLGENPLGNQVVATRRAQVVEELLVDLGFPENKIRKKILTWELPRLVSEDAAGEYGFRDDWDLFPNKQYMDQSVVLVAY